MMGCRTKDCLLDRLNSTTWQEKLINLRNFLKQKKAKTPILKPNQTSSKLFKFPIINSLQMAETLEAFGHQEKISKKILIIGSGGYIGSRLKEEIIAPDKVDINWFRSGGKGTDFKDLTREFYSEYDNIILLAGHSSVKMSEGNLNSCFNNNVRNFISKVYIKITFIYFFKFV